MILENSLSAATKEEHIFIAVGDDPAKLFKEETISLAVTKDGCMAKSPKAQEARTNVVVIDDDVVEGAFARIQPISDAIVPDRQAKKRWYGTHQFFTRRAWNIVQAYIKNYAPAPGSVVLDPFGGSGITAVEAAILGRRGYAFDINPFAVFYGQAAGGFYPNPLDTGKSELRAKFLEVINEYERLHPGNGLSDKKYETLAKSYGIPEKKILDHRVDCRTFELHTSRQLHDLSLLKKIIGERKYADSRTKQLLQFVFSATASKCNKTFVSARKRKASRGGARIFSSYALNLPPNPVELPVFPEFQNKFKKLLQAKQEVFLELSQVQNPKMVIDYCPAQEIDKKLNSESVDYIFTDPPYGKLIPYMDLSSFFCDWLDLSITKEIREKDIIENSSMHRTKEFYYAEMRKAFVQMYEALKYNRWMTLVYAHKNTEYWDAMISACQDAGFEFVNAVYEKPEVVWSLTKKKNKATTFSGELYLNFKKVKSAKGKLISILKNNFRSVIRNTVELAIVHNEGCASIEDIYSELVPVLARYGLTGKFRSEKIDIKDYLAQDFSYNAKKHGFELPPDRKLSSFIPIEERVLFYVKDFLILQKNLGNTSAFEEIVSNVLPNLVNGDIPSRESILDVLDRIAVKTNEGRWVLSEDEDGGQIDLPLPIASSISKVPPKTTPHNVQLWKLLFIGSKAGMSTYLGKNEQRDKRIADSGIPFLANLPQKLTTPQKRKIEQIDCIWLRNGQFEYAFEVEESTTVTSALERFSKLMEVAAGLSVNRRLVVVIPSRRIRKLKDVFTNSIYVGKPMYFENKIRILFSEDLDKLYTDCVDHYFKLSKLENALKRFDDI